MSSRSRPRILLLLRLAKWSLAALLVLELGLRLLGIGFLGLLDLQNAGADPEADHTILCLGDSITAIGGDEAYPAQLEQLLEQETGLDFQVVNAGIPGTDSRVILSRAEGQLLKWQPDFVTVMMGITDDMDWVAGLEATEGVPRWQRILRHLKTYRLLYMWSGRRALEREQEQEDRALREREQALLAQLEERSDPAVRVQLLDLYDDQDRAEDAIPLLERELEEIPSSRVYLGLARLHEDPAQKEKLFQEALARYPSDRQVYRHQMLFYRRQQRHDDAERILRLHLQRFPDVLSHVELARFHRDRHRYAEALQHLEAAEEIRPTFVARREMGRILAALGQTFWAEFQYRRSFELAPCPDTLVDLGRLWADQERFEMADRAFSAATGQGDLAGLLRSLALRFPDPRGVQAPIVGGPVCRLEGLAWDTSGYGNAIPWIERARLAQARGETEQAWSILREIAPNRMTQHNYEVLVSMVMPDPGRLVVMQYPTRPLEPLRAMVPPQEGIRFVDNESLFEEAIAREGYSALFLDHSGIDFGHATARGHTLLARNLADTLLRTWFDHPGLEVDPGAQ